MEENSPNNNDNLIIPCSKCGVKNRVPTARLKENPKCGKCGSRIQPESIATLYSKTKNNNHKSHNKATSLKPKKSTSTENEKFERKPKYKKGTFENEIKYCQDCGSIVRLSRSACWRCGYDFKQSNDKTERDKLQLRVSSRDENTLANKDKYNEIRYCPDCGSIVRLSRNSCWHCGYNFKETNDESAIGDLHTSVVNHKFKKEKKTARRRELSKNLNGLSEKNSDENTFVNKDKENDYKGLPPSATKKKKPESIYTIIYFVFISVLAMGLVTRYLIYIDESNLKYPTTTTADIEPILQKAVSSITEDIASRNPNGSRGDIKVSADMRAQGIEDGTKGDAESLKKAIIMLNQSLEFQYSAETMIDLAYYYSGLGHIGENTELNLIRSSGILDGLKLPENNSTKEAIQSTSLKILNKIRRGALKEASKMFSPLKELITAKGDMMPEYHIFLEAWYFLEKDTKKRVRISEELVRTSPKNPVYYNYWGVANYHAGDKKLAEECFERAVAINSKYTPAVENYNLIRENKKPGLKIISRLTEKWKKEPDNFPYSLGSILTRKVEIKGIQAGFLSVNPEDAKIKVIQVDIDTGRYQLEISSEGYIKKRLWVALYSDKILDINLNTFTNLIGMNFVCIKPGNFKMGSPPSESDRDNDETQHEVTLNDGFYMQTTEVTQGQWYEVMGTRRKRENYPAVNVSWKDTKEFIRRLNKKEGVNKYRLPTEAEWEYACRAGSTTRYYFGNSDNHLGDYAWYKKNADDIGEKYAHQVGKKKPNAWGLYDMHGNVWEWVEDDWHGYYKGAPDNGSAWIDEPRGAGRVIRGGGWNGDAQGCRSAFRDYGDPDYRRYDDVGFRLARSVALGP